MVRRSADYASFRRRLRQARVDAGLSQEAAAKRLGKPQSFISKCESGERRVDIVELAAFAKAYGKAIAFFVP